MVGTPGMLDGSKRATLALLCMGMLHACRLDVDVRSDTRLVLMLEVERALRASSQQLRVELAEGGSAETAASAPLTHSELLALDGLADDHIKQLRFTPHDGRAAPHVSITVTAQSVTDDGPRFVAQARVITRYVRGEARVVPLRLYAECRGVACDLDQSCEAGSCVTALRSSESLPLYYPRDAGRIQEDAALAPVDSVVDAGRTAAVEAPVVREAPRDAGPPAMHEAPHASGEVDAGLADPCAREHGGCDPLVPCYDTRGKPTCGVCPRGFEDVHDDGTLCRDIDECQSGKAGCAQHARCINQRGSFECTCEAGYSGDGHSCELADLCASDADCGGLVGACQLSAEGRRACVCPPGYVALATSCADVDECASGALNCGLHGRCVNRPGSADCQCEAGYGISLGTCVDVDECSALLNDCDRSPNACVNNDGSFRCRCPPGYSGNGRGERGCELTNICLVNNGGCDLHRDCLNTEGGPTCGDCQTGWRKDGPTNCLPE